MSAHTASLQDLTSRPAPLTVSFRLLLSLYLIIPVCLLLQLLDASVWDSYLKNHLPSSPSHFLLFQILFGTPHIVASAVVLASNQDYRHYYQRKIIWMTVALAAFFGVGSLFIPYKALYILVACWTVLHVLKQQHGVARGLCRLPAWCYHLLFIVPTLRVVTHPATLRRCVRRRWSVTGGIPTQSVGTMGVSKTYSRLL